ncbi:PP2C domain-containing protein [Cephalotus follicularis]|uniref:protein-serine/threonine phosphatase n=1 Tax=Cephalotus follicularis TaxID=3775 RepID=A0A1Q3B5Q5_CEPFO|nr:PP2C domain-containing protein [Cephalotus follicularis]
MGCVHGKCCTRYPSSTDSDAREVGPYSDVHNKHILTERSLELVPVPSHNYNLEYSVLTQRGYYPDSPDKENQDSYCIRTQLQGNPSVHFFGVFDGHGQFGSQCSTFVKDRLVQLLADDPLLLDDPGKTYNSAFLSTNYELHCSEIDDTMSGTTAITVLVIGDTLYVANAGDSRAVIAVKNGNRIVAEDLSNDQTPFRKDEYERVKVCGARVLSVDQVGGLKDPNVQAWGDEESQGGDPPRLWVQNGMYPGTAFTRSVGDSTAERIGVVADPEVSTVQLTPNHLFFVVASDGVFEFLSSQAVVNMAARYADPRDACAAIAGESYKLWLEHENRTDDITIVIVHIKDFSNVGGSGRDPINGTNTRPAGPRIGKGVSDISATSGSEIFHSVRSEFSESQLPHRHVVSTNRSPAIVVPSPTLQGPGQVKDP